MPGTFHEYQAGYRAACADRTTHRTYGGSRSAQETVAWINGYNAGWDDLDAAATYSAENRGAWGERFEYEGDRFDPSDESLPEGEFI